MTNQHEARTGNENKGSLFSIQLNLRLSHSNNIFIIVIYSYSSDRGECLAGECPAVGSVLRVGVF